MKNYFLFGLLIISNYNYSMHKFFNNLCKKRSKNYKTKKENSKVQEEIKFLKNNQEAQEEMNNNIVPSFQESRSKRNSPFTPPSPTSEKQLHQFYIHERKKTHAKKGIDILIIGSSPKSQ